MYGRITQTINRRLLALPPSRRLTEQPSSLHFFHLSDADETKSRPFPVVSDKLNNSLPSYWNGASLSSSYLQMILLSSLNSARTRSELLEMKSSSTFS